MSVFLFGMIFSMKRLNYNTIEFFDAIADVMMKDYN
jgi:hypothetical protein